MKQRIGLFDLWRSLAVCGMVAFHLCYDLALFGRIPMAAMLSLPVRAVGFLLGGSFLLLSGICLRFSRAPVRRGFLIFCAGLAVSLVSALAEQPVKFGILQCIGVCMMLCGALRERIEKKLGVGFALCCLALFVGTWWLTARVTVDIRFIYPLGFRSADFFSADYYPLLPWLLLYLLGMVLGRFLENHRDAAVLRRQFPRWMTFPGRHSLLIYLLHQPILYMLCRVMFG